METEGKEGHAHISMCFSGYIPALSTQNATMFALKLNIPAVLVEACDPWAATDGTCQNFFMSAFQKYLYRLFLVHLAYYDNITQADWLINDSMYCSQCWSFEIPRSGCHHGQMKVLFRVTRLLGHKTSRSQDLSPNMVEKTLGLSWASFRRVLIPFLRAEPLKGLTVSQRRLLPTPLFLVFRILHVNWGNIKVQTRGGTNIPIIEETLHSYV